MLYSIDKQPIKHLPSFVKKRAKDTNRSVQEIRAEIMAYNFPLYFKEDILKDYYLNKECSLPDFKKQFGWNYEQTLFALNWFKIKLRSPSEACKKCVPKRKKTVKARFGVDNPSQSEEIKKKKSDTFYKNYGVDNIFKSIDFQNSLDTFYLFKHGLNFHDFQKKRSKKVWENKTIEEKNQWLKDSILSDTAASNRGWGGYQSSSGENQISNILTNLNISHTRQFYLKNNNKRFFYDICIYNSKIIIEFNGDYWHANPELYKPDDVIKYPWGETKAKDIWQEDNFKQSVAKNRGYKIILIWEKEIKHLTSDELEFLVLAKIKNIEKQNETQ